MRVRVGYATGRALHRNDLRRRIAGAEVFTSDFVVAGTCSENLYGMCESLFRDSMEPEELFEVVSQALLSAVDRDAMSGWGAVVHIITPDGITTRRLKARMD